MSATKQLLEQAEAVLQRNDGGDHTIPSHFLYPHQWLWDSCFISIGLRHIDIARAKNEIISLLRGQWHNGMVPHIIFAGGTPRAERHRNLWRSWVNPSSPEDKVTSGITQPPVIAEAVVRIGELLPLPERRSWYRQVFPGLLAYHQWLYRERDPHGEGLTLQIHPWETGLDNSPPWSAELHEHLLPWWIRLIERTHLDKLISRFRPDVRASDSGERLTTVEALALFTAQRRLRRKAYDIDKILDHSLFAIEDLAFNCILVRANQHLRDIAKTIRAEIPADLKARMALSPKTLEELWDPYTGQYYPRDFVTHKLIKQPSIATLLPLYAGTIDKERAKLLVNMLEDVHMFGPAYPVPSVPINSPWFDSRRYWQGPTWLNINWLVADGLKRYGYHNHAAALIESSLELVEHSGFHEYFDPLNGAPLGVADFSWTAAVTIDWLSGSKRKP